MLFSSISFLYYFLPLLLIIYFIFPSKYRNYVLLVFSFIFYFLGEPKYIIILLLSCIINYYLSKLIEKKSSKLFLIIAVIYNVGQLLVFKYTDFFIDNINNIFNLDLSFMYIVMPIGISFFTFQALGYVIDVYKKKHESAGSLVEFMTYISLFPQLVAGPIVRYSDVKEDLVNRKYSYDKFYNGLRRFIIGLSKKILIANVLGEIVVSLTEVSFVSTWVKAILFTLQIYFDFSGYSDMAIGLGLMLGFKFLENFNYPLIASSITDFWRRWHMSLSSWFRDYIYIPLGGNREGILKQIRNIFVVWFLTGFWHGASWNFIIWGIYFGIILLIEKFFLKKFIDKTKVLKYVYTLFIVVISFMIFNSLTLSEIFINLKNMFMISDIPFITGECIYYLRSYIILFIISIISATPLFKKIYERYKDKKIVSIAEPIILFTLFILCTSYLIDASFNPFLYFRF